MSISIFQLLFVGMFVAVWYRFYLSQKAKSKRERDARAQTAADGRPSSLEEEPKPEPVLVESEPVPVSVAEFDTNESKTTGQCSCAPNGAVCIVGERRRRLRCTEYEVDGELQTEVCCVDKKGRTIGKPSNHVGPVRKVANELLGLKVA